MQPPFPAKGTIGARTRESLGGEKDPAGKDKETLETLMVAELVGYFRDQLGRLQAALEPRIPADRKAIQLPMEFWTQEEKLLLSILLPMLQQGAEGGVAVQRAIVDALGMQIDWTLPMTEASEWARKYSAELVKGVTETTKERIRSTVGGWIDAPQATLPDLWKKLMEDHAFSRRRAELIAATEATRAYAEGEMAGAETLEKAGYFGYDKIWQTAADDIVCPICRPLQGASVQGVRAEFDTLAGSFAAPPAHPGCRCWINTVPRIPEQ